MYAGWRWDLLVCPGTLACCGFHANSTHTLSPAGVPCATCSRSRSPTEMCTRLYCKSNTHSRRNNHTLLRAATIALCCWLVSVLAAQKLMQAWPRLPSSTHAARVVVWSIHIPSPRCVHTGCPCLLQVHQQSSHAGAAWPAQLSRPAASSDVGSNGRFSGRHTPTGPQLYTTSMQGPDVTAACMHTTWISHLPRSHPH